jgi:hypothetical protein
MVYGGAVTNVYLEPKLFLLIICYKGTFLIIKILSVLKTCIYTYIGLFRKNRSTGSWAEY